MPKEIDKKRNYLPTVYGLTLFSALKKKLGFTLIETTTKRVTSTESLCK